jgi:hypothetical protein
LVILLSGIPVYLIFLYFLAVVILSTFPSVGWVKYDVLLFIIIYATFLFCYSIHARKGNKNSEADSFRNIKVKHNAHLKMEM